MAVETPTPRQAARLHRSRRERMVFGVCGGLAESVDLDPAIVRLAFALVTLAGGAGLLLYIVLAVVLPEDDVPPGAGATYGMFGEERRARRHARQHLAAYALIAVGVIILVERGRRR